MNLHAAITRDVECWWCDQGEVLAFARVLVASDHFASETPLGDLLYYFEKPYKWDAERTAWVEAGRPETFEFGEGA